MSTVASGQRGFCPPVRRHTVGAVPPTTPRRPRRALGAVLLALVAGVTSAGSASAHDELASTTPDDATTVTAPPAVVLRFGEPVLTLGLVVSVSGPGGAAGRGQPLVAGTTVTQALRSPLAPGGYTTVWRAVSSDSHPVSGTFTFTVAAPTPASSVATVPVATPTSAAPLPPATAGGTVGGEPVPAGEGRGLALAGGALVLLLAAVTLAARRARR